MSVGAIFLKLPKDFNLYSNVLYEGEKTDIYVHKSLVEDYLMKEVEEGDYEYKDEYEEDADVYCNRGDKEFESNYFESAIEEYTKAIEIDNEFIRAYLMVVVKQNIKKEIIQVQ